MERLARDGAQVTVLASTSERDRLAHQIEPLGVEAPSSGHGCPRAAHDRDRVLVSAVPRLRGPPARVDCVLDAMYFVRTTVTALNANGATTLTVNVKDSSNNTGSGSVNVTVAN